MALHDYVHCGRVLFDVFRSVQEGASARPPACPECGEPMDWIPQVGAMDAFEPNAEFTTVDGQGNSRTIESFAQMRALERESEQQYRNGEGQPLRFRRLHQHRTNREVNTF